MMAMLASVFVGRPLNIVVVAAAFTLAGGAGGARLTAGGRRALLVAAGGWALYAAWEWLVVVRTPDANIRVDLLLIWPALALLSLWAVYRVIR